MSYRQRFAKTTLNRFGKEHPFPNVERTNLLDGLGERITTRVGELFRF